MQNTQGDQGRVAAAASQVSHPHPDPFSFFKSAKTFIGSRKLGHRSEETGSESRTEMAELLSRVHALSAVGICTKIPAQAGPSGASSAPTAQPLQGPRSCS